MSIQESLEESYFAKHGTLELPKKPWGLKDSEIPTAFVDWINNNWLVPSTDGFWKLDTSDPEYVDPFNAEQVSFTSEELFKRFMNEEGWM